tara:strand:+ start:843 stop:1040 length:198 start_codon:yes stop_codon:yes gene_type:complete
MKCWHCKTELIWGADHDLEDNDEFIMVTNLSCPNCGSYVEVYYPKQKTRKDNIYEFKKNSTRKKP